MRALPLPSLVLLGVFLLLTLANLVDRMVRRIFPIRAYLHYTWLLLLAIVAADLGSFTASVWLLAVLSFLSLREYFSLVSIRLQDRLGILGAYLTIPFLFYFVQIDWYGMFIVSVPVYGFLVIPLLVALGGREAKGAVFSIGVIDLGMFLFVYCVGHVASLVAYSTWAAALLTLGVALCDAAGAAAKRWIPSRAGRAAVRCLAPLPFTLTLFAFAADWARIPPEHAVVLACMTPLLCAMGQFTLDAIRSDLGAAEEARPGRGQIMGDLGSFLYAAPVFFHYVRYFLT